MSKKTNKSIAPIDAKTFGDICSLPRDNISCRGFWILTDGYYVSIHQQKPGEDSKQQIRIPRSIFDHFVRWYVTGSSKKSRIVVKKV